MKHGTRSTTRGQSSHWGATAVIALLACCVAGQPAAAEEVVAWGLTTPHPGVEWVEPPAGLSGVIALAAGGHLGGNKAPYGGGHSLALKSNGTVVAWGRNDYDQCDVPAGLTGVTAIAGGSGHSLALKSDGTVVGWGHNGAGQCDAPALPAGVAYTAIAAGLYHSLAVRSDGRVAAWGYNSNGQCDVPDDLTSAKAVDGGPYHSLALKEDGTVVMWGWLPGEMPPTLVGVKAIASAWRYCLALKTDGTVVVSGNPYQHPPPPPAGLTGVTQIAAGGFHFLALKSDGTVVAWGRNHQGQCNVPAGLTGVSAIAAGSFHSLALQADTTPPTIVAIAATPNILWSPNHRMEEVTVTVAVTDDRDPAPVCEIIDVLCNEPANGPGDGNKEPDWEITGDLTVKLRAERSGRGGGRVYTIIVEATDASGNAATAEVDVTVPHDKKK